MKFNMICFNITGEYSTYTYVHVLDEPLVDDDYILYSYHLI